MIAANDGLFDGPGFNSDESQLMANCLHLLLRVLLTLFAWSVIYLYILRPLSVPFIVVADAVCVSAHMINTLNINFEKISGCYVFMQCVVC